jgi:hypothetical protein
LVNCSRARQQVNPVVGAEIVRKRAEQVCCSTGAFGGSGQQSWSVGRELGDGQGETGYEGKH